MQPTISENKKERLTDSFDNLNELITDLLLIFDELNISDEKRKEYDQLLDKVILAMSEVEEEIYFT